MLRRLFGTARQDTAPFTAQPIVLDGLSAVAAIEALISDAAALGASYPASAGARALSKRRAERAVNSLGQILAAVDADSPRGALATAIGMSMSGRRATAFFSGPDIASAQDLLAQTSNRHLPLVIHLACRASMRTLGSGHEAYMASGDAGLFQLFATNGQEAADFALIARRVAERSLVPGMIAMDGEQTAMASQEVSLPGDEFLRSYIGEPTCRIGAPTEAQRLIFGNTRRLIPRWYDLEHPTMLGSLEGSEAWALGEAGRRPYFEDHLPLFLTDAFEEFAAATGRRYDALYEHHLDDAEIILIAQGSAVETLTAAADHMRKHERLKVGVLGIRCLRPLPGGKIAEFIKGAKVAVVLERMDSPLADESPLIREIRAILDRSRENARYGHDTHRGYPAIHEKQQPRIVSAPFGLGGLPLRATDLLSLINELKSPTRSLVYLGLDFTRSASTYPKRQALLDSLRRSHGEINDLSLRSTDSITDVRSDGATTIAIHRMAGDTSESLAGDAAALIHEAFGGCLRSRPALSWQRFDQPCVDYITHSPQPLLDAGDDAPVDIAVLAAETIHQFTDPVDRVLPGGKLLLVGGGAPDEVISALPAKARRQMQAKAIKVFAVASSAEAARRREALLGGMMAVFTLQSAETEAIATNIRAARETALVDLPESERESSLDALVAAYESTTRVELTTTSGVRGEPGELPAPSVLDHLSRSDETAASLPRFWDHTGVLYREGRTEELTADPYMAAGAVPPLSSAFRDVSDARSVLPVFDPETCDGDGRLWTSCPDGSIAATVISARALIDTGIELASSQGRPADNLRSIAAKLAKGVNNIIAEQDKPPMTARGLLTQSFDALMAKNDNRSSLQDAFDAIVDAVGDLPLGPTEAFFAELERKKRGTGEFLIVAVNPDACKCPEVTFHALQGRGLKLVKQTPENLRAARRLWDLWQTLPDTSGETIERARTHPKVGPLAAIMLSRQCQSAMAGGDGAEAGSGAKLALRQVLAAAEYHLQPRLQRHLQQIDSLRSKLAARIRETLADALPTGDLDALGKGLDLLGRSDVDLATLSGKVDKAVAGGSVDGARLGRLVDAARGLADLHWRLSHGPDGFGRARSGMAIAPGSVAAWAGAFPNNPFKCPVAIDAGGETSQLARGLIEGQLQQAIAGLRLARWANLELDKPNEAEYAAEQLASLTFDDLTDEERALCPPMLIVGDGQALGERGLSQLAWLFNCKLPVKVVVLSDIGGEADGAISVDALGDYGSGRRYDLALLALLSRDAFVVQTSPADGEHFINSVLGAMAYEGPALIHIHAPSPQRHGFSPQNLHEQARLAVNTRAFPLLTFDPSAEGVFGSRLDISANPDPDSLLLIDDDGKTLTPLDWTSTEHRFAEHFERLTGDDPAPIPANEYLALNQADRAGSTPFVNVIHGEEQTRFRVGNALIEDTEHRLRLWRTLQELAGVVTPFTKQVREAAERDVAQLHEEAITQVKSEYEAKLAQLRAEYDADATRRVTDGLLALAGHGSNGAQGEDNAT